MKRLSNVELNFLHGIIYRRQHFNNVIVEYRQSSDLKSKTDTLGIFYNQYYQQYKNTFEIQNIMNLTKQIQTRQEQKDVNDPYWCKHAEIELDGLMFPFLNEHLGCKQYNVYEEKQIIDSIENNSLLPRVVCCIVFQYVTECM